MSSMITFRDLFYCYECNTCKHYIHCANDRCETECSDSHRCTCGETMVRPLLTTEQREDLIRCIPTTGYEVELYVEIFGDDVMTPYWRRQFGFYADNTTPKGIPVLQLGMV